MPSYIECKVKTNSKKNSIKFEDEKLIVEISAKPVRGEANKELLKFLKKQLHKDVEIVTCKTLLRFDAPTSKAC